MLGNDPHAPALEILGSAHFRAEREVSIAVVGSGSIMRGPMGESESRGSVHLKEGDELEIRQVRPGFATMIAFGGGVRQLDGTYAPWTDRPREFRILSATSLLNPPGCLRLLPSPDRYESPELWTSEFQISPNSNRKGLKLIGKIPADFPQKASSPVTPGVIQLPPGGEPIILGPDGPTLGGYARIGVVCQADMCRIGQLGMGRTFQFEPIDYEAAEAALLDLEERLSTLELGLRG